MRTSLRSQEYEDLGPVSEDQLRLIFTCCHPCPSARTSEWPLRCDCSAASVWRKPPDLSWSPKLRWPKRLVRAKYKIKAANIAYRVPREADLPERLRSVLSVLYLIYNTGADTP